MADSSIPKFFEKSREERIDIVSRFCNLTSEEVQVLKNSGGISFNQADGMIENAIGTLSFPLGIATNFQINGKDYLVPMVIEEPSVIAAASKAAKIARKKGGFTAQADESYSIGQIQVIGAEVKSASNSVMESSNEILQLANTKSKSLSKMGRGAKQVSCREIKASSGSMLVVELLIDVGEAMGANITNTMCEAVAPLMTTGFLLICPIIVPDVYGFKSEFINLFFRCAPVPWFDLKTIYPSSFSLVFTSEAP